MSSRQTNSAASDACIVSSAVPGCVFLLYVASLIRREKQVVSFSSTSADMSYSTNEVTLGTITDDCYEKLKLKHTLPIDRRNGHVDDLKECLLNAYVSIILRKTCTLKIFEGEFRSFKNSTTSGLIIIWRRSSWVRGRLRKRSCNSLSTVMWTSAV